MADFKNKVAKLQGELDACKAAKGGESSMSTMTMVGIAIPFIIAIGLYLASPSWIHSQDEDDKNAPAAFSWAKLLMYTGIFTLIIWGCMYGFTYTSMYSGESK
jgi:predicted secreted protein